VVLDRMNLLAHRLRSVSVAQNLGNSISKYQSVQYLTGKLDRSSVVECLAANGYCFYRDTNLHNDLFSEDEATFSGTTQHVYNSLFGEDYKDKLMNYGVGTDSRDNHKSSSLLSVSKISNQHWVPYHNELMYTDEFPRYIAFICIKPAKVGGFTPVSNSIDTWEDLPLVMQRKFEKHGIRYMRNLRDKYAEEAVENNCLNLGGQKFLQDIFGTNNVTQLEAMCHRLGYDFEWRTCPMNKTPILHIQYVAQAVVDWRFQNKTVRSFANSVTGMNGRYFKGYGDPYYEELALTDRPFHSQWGNGDEFNDEEHGTIEQCQHANSMCFEWKAGDVFIADNVAWSHGRTPYEGERQILAIMGDPYHRYISEQ